MRTNWIIEDVLICLGNNWMKSKKNYRICLFKIWVWFVMCTGGRLVTPAAAPSSTFSGGFSLLQCNCLARPWWPLLLNDSIRLVWPGKDHALNIRAGCRSSDINNRGMVDMTKSTIAMTKYLMARTTVQSFVVGQNWPSIEGSVVVAVGSVSL